MCCCVVAAAILGVQTLEKRSCRDVVSLQMALANVSGRSKPNALPRRIDYASSSHTSSMPWPTEGVRSDASGGHGPRRHGE
ncbi:unnamed protein product, partial [Ectocarpus sp. 12 AP-2014]